MLCCCVFVYKVFLNSVAIFMFRTDKTIHSPFVYLIILQKCLKKTLYIIIRRIFAAILLLQSRHPVMFFDLYLLRFRLLHWEKFPESA